MGEDRVKSECRDGWVVFDGLRHESDSAEAAGWRSMGHRWCQQV